MAQKESLEDILITAATAINELPVVFSLPVSVPGINVACHRSSARWSVDNVWKNGKAIPKATLDIDYNVIAEIMVSPYVSCRQALKHGCMRMRLTASVGR